MRFDAYSYTDKGGRGYNEDSVGFLADENRGLFVVADGLGGHSLGEVASKCVIDTLISSWPTERDDLKEWVRERLYEANRNVLNLQKERNAITKSTAVFLTVLNGLAVWGHVGDSRLYYIHDGRLICCTEDHSVAFKKFKAGEITKEQIALDEDQSQLLRSLGSEDRNEPTIGVLSFLVEPGDAFFLCSDGAWEFLMDEEIVIDHCKSMDAKQWNEWLRLRMMDRVTSNHDNLSLLTVMVS